MAVLKIALILRSVIINIKSSHTTKKYIISLLWQISYWPVLPPFMAEAI